MLLNHRIFRQEGAEEWIVFLHGFGGTSSIWFKQIYRFAREYNLLLIDLRGHGGSREAYTGSYSFQAIARDVLNVMDSLGLGRCHFMGVSLGTIVIREVAELDVGRVRSMGMAGAVVGLNVRSRFLLKVAREVQNRIPYMWIYRLYAHILMPKKRHEQSRNLFICDAMRMNQVEFLRWFALTAYLRPLLRLFRSVELPVPTLYLMGEEDYMFLPQVRALLREHRRHSSLVVVPDSGHVCNVDNAGFFNQTALDFLKSIQRKKI